MSIKKMSLFWYFGYNRKTDSDFQQLENKNLMNINA